MTENLEPEFTDLAWDDEIDEAEEEFYPWGEIIDDYNLDGWTEDGYYGTFDDEDDYYLGDGECE